MTRSAPFRRIATAQQIFIAPRMRDPDKYRDRDAAFGDELRSHRAGARLLGDRRARARIADLLRLGRRRLSLGLRCRLPRSAMRRRPSSTGCPSAASGPRRSRRAARRSINSRSARMRAEGMLNVLVRAEGGGDWMGGPEVSGGDVALLRLPIAAFGDGSQRGASRALPAAAEPEGDELEFPQPLRRRPCPLWRRRVRRRTGRRP